MWIKSKKCWGFCLLLITVCLCYADRDVRSHFSFLLLHSSIHWQFEWFIVVHENHTFIQSRLCSDLNKGYYFPFLPFETYSHAEPTQRLLYNSSCAHVHVPCASFVTVHIFIFLFNPISGYHYSKSTSFYSDPLMPPS